MSSKQRSPSPPPPSSPRSLLSLSSIIVSSKYPFALIESIIPIIPSPVQKSLIYHSFPKNESDVLVYASSDFNADKYQCADVVQIGLWLHGVVYEIPVLSKKSSRRRSLLVEEEEECVHGNGFKVSANFDRGKITSVACNCDNESSLIFWCDHVISLALHRIRRSVVGVDFVLRVPISETLHQLTKIQLQKLVQYLISDHTDVLPTAQRLADEIQFMKTDDNYINRIHGAPDITAGPPAEEPNAWALNEPQIQSQVRSYVTLLPTQPHQNVINTLIEKAYRMIKSRDSNATRIVQIITNELVRHVTRPSPQPRPSIPPQIWDQITKIWNVLVLKPSITDQETNTLKSVLKTLSINENLPGNEDPSDSEDEQESPKRQKLSYSIFTYPLKLLNKQVNDHDYNCSVLHSRVCHGDEDTKFALKILDNLKSGQSSIRVENAHVLYDVLNKSHPKEAYEAALIGLTCHSNLKPHVHVHEKHMKNVEKLIQKIHSLGITYNDVLNNHASKLLSDTQHPRSFPKISFITYAYNTLNSTLGYKLALKHLSMNDYVYVHSHLESQQISLATTLLTSQKNDEASLEEISSTIIRVVKSNTSLFKLAGEVFRNASNDKLVNVAFNMALHVVKATKYTAHRRRWEMVRWVVSCGVEIGVAKLFYLVRNWGEYFTAVEAVGTVASNILAWVGGGVVGGQSCGSGSQCTVANGNVSCRPNSAVVDKRVLEELGGAARNLAIQCAKNDPQNCALNTLTLCETDPIAYDTSYQIVLESASKEFLTPQQIFTIARYMEHRGFSARAYRLAVIALQFVHIGYNQDPSNNLISEIHWTCNLSHQLSSPLPLPPPPPPPSQAPSSSSRTRYLQQQPSSSSTSTRSYYPNQRVHPHTSSHPLPLSPPTTEIDNLIPLLIRNIKCATVLTEILRRSIAMLTSYENSYQKTSSSQQKKLKQRVYEKLSLLIEGTIDSYITTVHSRLHSISPRHYSDFIEFLTKARENFLLAPNGQDRFNRLIESMKLMKSLRGKKKLLFLLNERFR